VGCRADLSYWATADYTGIRFMLILVGRPKVSTSTKGKSK